MTTCNDSIALKIQLFQNFCAENLSRPLNFALITPVAAIFCRLSWSLTLFLYRIERGLSFMSVHLNWLILNFRRGNQANMVIIDWEYQNSFLKLLLNINLLENFSILVGLFTDCFVLGKTRTAIDQQTSRAV